MAAKRKQFNCHNCGIDSSKTISSHNSQFKRLGYVLCTECSLKRNAEHTSCRMGERYKNQPKNRDIVTTACADCGKPKKMQRRAIRDGYVRCKSCAAKINRRTNASLYRKLAARRSGDHEFAIAVSNGMLAVPEVIRSVRSKRALDIRWSNTDDRCREFIKRSSIVHNNRYDYSSVKYENSITPVVICCSDHGDFTMTPGHHLYHGYGCPRCSELTTISSGHSEVAAFLESVCETPIKHNVRSIIPPYEVDIWLPEFRLAIEYHGVYWHSFDKTETVREKTLHKTKADLADLHGIRLLQIFETEWLQKQQIVKSVIAAKIGINERVFARKCTGGTPHSADYVDFMAQNHLQGYRPSSYTTALWYDDEMIAAIGISKHGQGHELIRYATKCGYTVVGGLSKLLAAAGRDLGSGKLISYVDRRYYDGSGYLKCGFDWAINTRPNYFYTTGNRYVPLASRQSYQKHKLPRKLEVFDINMTESANMFMNGFRRIWDAGHMRLSKTFP